MNTSHVGPLHVLRYGHGPQPVLLLHGSFATSAWWHPLLHHLPADEYTAYAPDLPGCGASARPAEAEAYRVPTLAEAVLLWLNEQALGPVHMLGHALGAAIALQCAYQQPWQIRTATLLSCPSPEGSPTPAIGYALLQDMQHDRALLAQALAGAMATRPPDAFFHSLVDAALQQAPMAYTAGAEALEHWRLPRAALQQITLPVLLLWGDRDPILSRQQQLELLLALPGADNLDVLTGCGHTPMLEKPLAVAERWLTFVNQDFAGFAAIRGQAEAEPNPPGDAP